MITSCSNCPCTSSKPTHHHCLGENGRTKLDLTGQSQSHAMAAPAYITQLLSQHGFLFDDQLGTLNRIQAKLALKDGEAPAFHKARPVPFAKRKRLSERLDHVESQGIIEKVQYSEWAALIIAVDKPDGGVRICGDFKTTISPVIEVDKYPLPKIEEIFTNIAVEINSQNWIYVKHICKWKLQKNLVIFSPLTPIRDSTVTNG